MEHDLRNPYWGHNYSVNDWSKGDLFVWLTPGPKVGDILLLSGHKGTIRAEVVKSDWTVNVDDMYRVKVRPAHDETPEEGP